MSVRSVKPTAPPKYRQIEKQLADAIVGGTLSAGALLPSETELMAQFHVGRNTVRRALAALRRNRLIAGGQGRQNMVAVIPPERGNLLPAGWLDYNYLGAGEPVYFEIFAAASRYAERNGIRLQFVNARNPEELHRYLKESDRMAGTLMTGITQTMLAPADFDGCCQLLRLVAVDEVHGSPARFSVATDNAGGAQLAVRRLAAAGRRQIAFLGVCPGFRKYYPFGERLRGYREALRQLQLPNDRDHEIISERVEDFVNVRPLLRQTLQRHPEIDAFFVSTDYIAIQALYGLQGEWRVPDDIAVIGFDGILMGAHTSPGLTTVAHPCEELGRRAVETLQNLLQGTFTGPHRQRLMPILIERESVSPSTNHQTTTDQ